MPINLQTTGFKYRNKSGQFQVADCLKGDTGQTPELSVGTVSTLEPNESASVSITGTPEQPVLNFGIPKGRPGDTGDPTSIIDDAAGDGDTNKVWSADKAAEELSAKYEKPAAGIPAADIASGVIPNVTGKADKVSNATNGNFAGLDANGNLVDSGKNANNFTNAEIVSVSATQPTDEANKLWIKSQQQEEITIPTYAEFSQLSNALNQSNAATNSDIGKAHSPKTVVDGKVTEWQYVEVGGGGGTSDYSDLQNKPQINGVTLSGNKTSSDLGVPTVQDTVDAVDDWLEENITNPDSPPLDRSLTSENAAAPADLVGEFRKEVGFIQEELYSYSETTAAKTINNVCIIESGFYKVDVAYKTLYYKVVPGQFVKVVSNEKIQFQSTDTYITSGDPVRVGTTYNAGERYLVVPENATYLAVSSVKTESDPVVSFILKRFTNTLDRLISDEELAIVLETRKGCIREIDLSSYLFDTNKQSVIASIDPETMYSRLDGLTIPANYACERIGLRVLYLPKGSTVITNIDSFYDGSTFPAGTFNIGARRGVILANIQNNSETVTGTVAYGREKFDGKYREIEITYTDYYCLFYRTDVSYTNKVYVYYPDYRVIQPNEIGITDITSTVRMQDGWYQYAGNGNWYDNLSEGNGSAGRYHSKSAFLHLTGNAGKSLFVDGMSIYSGTGNALQPVIRYTDNGDDTYTPDANSVIYPQFTIAKHNYITVPLSDKDDIRVQFSATASPAYVRFLIVPNEMLIAKGLVNPVFYGKKILGYGDSYIAGQSAPVTWHYVLSQMNYGTYVNRGHGGAGLCFGAGGSLVVSDRISELDEDADIYFLCFGRNDNSTNIQIGNNDDELDTSVTWDANYLIYTATFKGAMNYLFNYIETRHPFATIITVTPWGFENNAGVTSGLSCLDYIDAMQEMSKKWGVTCFNAAGDAGIHVRIAAFRTQYFLATDDQSHLNADGHLLMADRAGKLLTNLLYDG